MKNIDKDFLNSKKVTLEKLDKSPKGSIDKKILNLCNIINNREDMYTLSTCSGRVCLLTRKLGKKETFWPFITHNKVIFDEINEVLTNKISNEDKKNTQFRCEAVIAHIAVKNLEIAKKLIEIAKKSGFNQCGIISLRKIVVEIICDADIICPCENLSQEYLKILVEKSNENLEISWESIKKIEKNLKEI